MKNNKLTQNDFLKMNDNNNGKKKKRVLRPWVKNTFEFLIIALVVIMFTLIFDQILILKGF